MKIDKVNLLVNIPFYVNMERMPLTNQVLASVLAIQANSVHVIMDINHDAQDHEVDQILKDPRIELIRAPKFDNPFMLTWESKKHLENFLKSEYTHCVYLEDDMDFKQHHLEYWLETKDLFDKTRYIPGFIRIEFDKDNRSIATDWLHKQRLDFVINVKDRSFFSPLYPYHAMYIMDHELAAEHLSSPMSSFSYKPQGWGEREWCNEAYYYFNPPTNVPLGANGLKHRILLPIPNITDCLIHHTTNKFALDPTHPHGKLALDDLFI